MANQAQYRFLPWTRRGLVAEVQQVDTRADLPKGRATISVGVTVTNAGTNGVDLALYGPGDVLGIDSRLIVRTSPRAGSTNVETNYFAAIEFDPPDFPWMFTPAKADNNQRLRPWLVLLVLDRASVALPTVDRTRPLPTITISGDVAAQELPDLSESWAWAHTQVMTEDSTPNSQLPGELQQEPDLNVSRLICPRRLMHNRQYFACLVPAFDAGVLRGLGGKPNPANPLKPAWGATPGDVQLPVYYHWEFATGPLGDFESLAEKLKPFACPDSVGVIPMYIGDGNPLMPEIPPDQNAANTLMDGALRAPARQSGALSDIDQQIQDGLQTALNLPSKQLETGPQDATPILGLPIYGQWHAKQHTIAPNNPKWLYELNLDPRSRVAAGLGAEVVRKFQEEFMQKAWEQVGDILSANNWLNWGRLSLEANKRLYMRHFTTLPNDRLLQLTQALHPRTLYREMTIRTAVRLSSLPNAVADPAMRRLVSPQRPLLKTVIRRLTLENRLSTSYRNLGRSTLAHSLARGRLDVDPTRFVPDGVTSSITLDQLQLDANVRVVDLADFGLNVQLESARIRTYRTQVREWRNTDFAISPPQIRVRTDLRLSGLITRTHVSNIVALDLVLGSNGTAASNVYSTIGKVLDAAVQNPSAKGILITLNNARTPILNPLDIKSDGTVFTRTSPNTMRVIGTIDPALLNRGVDNITHIISELPVGTFDRRGTIRPQIAQGTSNEILLRGSGFAAEQAPKGVIFSPGGTTPVIPIKRGTLNIPLVPPGVILPPIVTPPPVVIPPVVTPPPVTPPPVVIPPPRPSNTVPMPLINVEAITKFESVLGQVVKSTGLNRPVESGALVPFDLSAAARMIVQRIDPVVMVSKRMAEMIKVGGRRLADIGDLDVHITPTFDRIMAAPEFQAAAYRYLAIYDQERFVPGIGIIPPNSITLLETNPRFIEGFMVGLNYEMNREYLWRALPTDQRATSWRFFWEWLDRIPDIAPIHRWRKNTILGANTRGAGAGGQLVLLVRGELVRRYPNAVLLAWKATANGRLLTDIPEDASQEQRNQIIKRPVFQGKLDPDIIFAGFDLVDKDLEKDGGWFFIIQEQPTEPRFGFDQPNGAPTMLTRWSQASWAHTGVAEGAYLRLNANPLDRRTFNGLTFGANAAHMASITLQQPMRVAVHGRYLVQ